MEEHVGALWHKLITRAADASYGLAEVRLADMHKGLGLFFRALGGDAGLQLEVAESLRLNRRRSWLQRVAGSGDRFDASGIDQRALKLPARIACFEQAALNRALYYWLAALAAHQQRILDPALNHWINRNQLATLTALQAYPGLMDKYRQLVEAHLVQRPNPASLPATEQAVEHAIRSALLQPGSVTALPRARRDPFPVPLWLHDFADQPSLSPATTDEQQDDSQPSPAHELEEMSRRKAERVKLPEQDRGLVTIRMENIFTWGEFVNVDRGHEDEDDAERAEAIARDLDRLSVAQQQQSSGLRLKFDLDLPSAAEDDQVLNNGILLPEWDWKKGTLLPNHCRIVEMQARNVEAQELPEGLRATANKLKNQFQHLTPVRTWLRHQIDGQELDLESYLRFTAERRAGLAVDGEHFYRDLRQGKRDMACLLLADLSLSTDSWVSDQQRVIDVIRDSLWLFAESLDAVGDAFSMLGFSSRRRDPIRIHLLKRFEESYNAEVRGRIGQVKPGYYTRLGAGIRYAAQKLSRQPAARQLLLILTDGKPNDLDQYEGRYGIEDTRQAILEARQLGLQPFCVTIDRKGNEYLPHLFGKNGFIVIRNPLQMPKYLPRLYVQMTQSY
jgi:nitric oxide reductase NorD protein